MNYKKTFILSLLIMLTVGLYSVTHYVSINGNNANPGTSSAPWLTIDYAVSQVSRNDIIIVKPGTYSVSTTTSNTFTIQGENTATCKIKTIPGSGNIFDVTRGGSDRYYSTLTLKSLTFMKGSDSTATKAIRANNNCIKISDSRFVGFTNAISTIQPLKTSLTDVDKSIIEDCVFDSTGAHNCAVSYYSIMASGGTNTRLPILIQRNQFNLIDGNFASYPESTSIGHISFDYVDGEIIHNNFSGDRNANCAIRLISIYSSDNDVDISNNSADITYNVPDEAAEPGEYWLYCMFYNSEASASKFTCRDNNIVGYKDNIRDISYGIYLNVYTMSNNDEISVTNNIVGNHGYSFTITSERYTRCLVKLFNNTSYNASKAGFSIRAFGDVESNVRNNLSFNSAVSDFVISDQLIDPDVTLYYNAFEKEPVSNVICDIDPTCVYRDSLRDYFDEDNRPLSTSPTIDAGDPNLDYDAHGYYADIDDQDPDGTRLDMGCYSYTHTYDEKHVHNGWNWVGFPRLRGTNGTEGINDVLPYTADYKYMSYNFLNEVGGPAELLYNRSLHRWRENILINSISGYKLEIDSLDFFADYQNYGTRIDPATTFGLYSDMPAGNWVDYFVPYAQNIKDAFGIYFDRVESVQGENWYYHVPPETPKGEEQELYIWSTEGKDLEFGKAYVVVVKKDIPQFQWQSSYTISTPNKPEKTLFFSYRDKADYETVEIAAMDSLENVQEIGVFEDGVCVGAKKFTGLPMQILCYTDRVNRSDSPLSIQVYTGSRSNNSTSYLTYDESEGQYSAAPILAGRQDYSIVRLLGNQSNSQASSVAMMSQNYPNPFSSTTRISCYLPKAQKVKVSVYNVKGQIIRTLDDANKAGGKFEIEWDGKNDSGQNVANGVYFYRLETKSKTILKKMLYLK